MKKSDLVRKSMQILIEHYQNSNVMLENCADQNFIWVEPEDNAPDRKNTTETAAGKPDNDRHILFFSLRNIVLNACMESEGVCGIILQYCKDIWLKKSLLRSQTEQMHLTWVLSRDRKGSPKQSGCCWKVFMISVIPIAGPETKKRMPLPVGESLRVEESPGPAASSRMLQIHVHDKAIRLLHPSSVIWAESVGIHSRIHTPLGTIEASESIHMLEKLCSFFLLRPHASYLVNPAYIITIRRFEIELSDGSVIPIPQRKYTQTRDRILRHCKVQNLPGRAAAAPAQ